MRLPIFHVLLALLLACHSGHSAPAHAQARAGGGAPVLALPGQPNAPSIEESTALKIARWDAEAELIEKVLADGDIDSETLEGLRATLDAQLNAITGLLAAARSELAPLERQRGALGARSDDVSEEPALIEAERTRLGQRIAEIGARVRLLAQADARAVALLERLSALRRQMFTRELLTRGPSLFDPGVITGAVVSFRHVLSEIHTETSERVARRSFGLPYLGRAVLNLLLIGVALYFVLRVRRTALRWLEGAPQVAIGQSRRVLTGIAMTLVRLLVPVIALSLALLAIWNSELFGPVGQSRILGLAATFIVVTGAYALGGAYYSPHAPQFRLSSLGEKEAAAAHRWLMGLAAVVGLDRMLVVQDMSSGHSIEALQLINTCLLAAGGAIVWGYARYISDGPETGNTSPPERLSEEREVDQRSEFAIAPLMRSWARVLAYVIAIVAPVLAVLGYFAASRYIFYPVVLSGAVIGLCVLLYYAVHDVVQGFDAPSAAEAGEAPSRLRLAPVIAGFLLICAAIPVLAMIWGAEVADIGTAWRTFSRGIPIGETTIAPLSFFTFLVVFLAGYLATRLVQRILTGSVLPLTGLDSGGRAAISAGVFYLGVVLSGLIAISTAGLDLSNIAIVAGALSVGIGFGLQNIVNNFISGIILLIERPIKAGDWVELGSGSGYVRQINVRSTEIETFDRAALIVPNSELISGPVTNWTHNSLNGRLIVPIGVAYGTDPRMVATMLTEIARAHPMLLRHPAPFVLFRRFGADALEFEIRGLLRDVNWILNVTSDINFEIARRFAEAGIEIPFAQRDLHLRNAGELGRSIGEAVRGESGRSPDPDRTEES